MIYIEKRGASFEGFESFFLIIKTLIKNHLSFVNRKTNEVYAHNYSYALPSAKSPW